MSARNILMAAAGSADDKLYVDDVFSAHTYTGNDATQTINNGIDLAGKGGLVWTKARSIAYSHQLVDTLRGVSTSLIANSSGAQVAFNALASFNSTGYTTNAYAGVNGSGQTFVSWTFRKAPKFFDVVTYSGNNVSNRPIAHSLGVSPGMVIVKNTGSIGNNYDSWNVWHRSTGQNNYLELETINGAQYSGNGSFWGASAPTNSHFYLGSPFTNLGSPGQQYVAYLFAHDPSADGIIQCGSFTTDGGGNATVSSIGWEPQYGMFKATSTTGNWIIMDQSRHWNMSASGLTLWANDSAAETSTFEHGNPTATGFSFKGAGSTTYIYVVIRRPNKPPTTGTQVYNAIARTGTGAAATVTGVGFAPDMALIYNRDGATGNGGRLIDRLRGGASSFRTDLTASESVLSTMITSFDMNGISLGTNGNINQSDATFISHFFRRAPGVFDVVCYTGNGATPRPIDHSLGVTPQLAIVKSRNTGGYNWKVTFFDGTSYYYLLLNVDDVSGSYEAHFYGIVNSFTDTSFSVITDPFGNGISAVNQNAGAYIAYLFASLPGISKVGKYIGNGSTQTINCGFSTGSRFVLIKRMNAAGDWYVWDTARGIIAANDPHLSLNSTAAEVTTNDSVDPDSTGFIVNQVAATNVNVSDATYLFLAIA